MIVDIQYFQLNYSSIQAVKLVTFYSLSQYWTDEPDWKHISTVTRIFTSKKFDSFPEFRTNEITRSVLGIANSINISMLSNPSVEKGNSIYLDYNPIRSLLYCWLTNQSSVLLTINSNMFINLFTVQSERITGKFIQECIKYNKFYAQYRTDKKEYIIPLVRLPFLFRIFLPQFTSKAYLKWITSAIKGERGMHKK